MGKINEQITEILNSLTPLLEAHDCYMKLSAINGNKVFIYCGGQGAVCDNKCVEEAIKEKIPNIEIVYI